MPVYNGERFLAQAIDSILAQTLSDFEFIIVDDGSTDGSAEIIRDYAQRDERIRLVQHGVNRGQASALNSGIAAARAKYIALIDSDDLCLPERLRKQTAYLDANPDIGVIGTNMRLVDQHLKPIRNVEFPQRHLEIILGLCFRKAVIAGASVMMRTAALRAVGGYDPQRHIGNDRELFLRMAGETRFVNLPECLYLYRQHDDNMTKASQHELYQSWREIHALFLQRLWGEAPGAAADRLDRLRLGKSFDWRERRQLRRDLDRLADSLIVSNCVDETDRSVLKAEFARWLEGTLPRGWQKFLYWRRDRLGF